MRVVAGLGIIAALAGCSATFDETTFVRVHDLSNVTVGVSSPRGGEWLLAAGGPAETKEVPDSNPPLTEGRKFATVTRSPGGQVALECPSCKGNRGSLVVANSGVIELGGRLAENTKWEPDHELKMRYSHQALFPCYRHPNSDCPREAIGLWLSTPQSNVVEVRHKKTVSVAHGERTGAWIGLFVGGFQDAAGLALAGTYAFDSDARKPITLVVAAAFLTIGSIFLGTSTATLRAHDTDEIIYRGPAKPKVDQTPFYLRAPSNQNARE